MKHTHTSVGLTTALMLGPIMLTQQIRALLLASALVSSIGCLSSPVDTASSAVSDLTGTREEAGVLLLLNDSETATFAFLDDDVRLNSRAATNLVAYRDGQDGVANTEDDLEFESLEEVDAVRYVGPSTIAQLVEFATDNNWVPSDNDELGSFDGIPFSYLQAEQVLSLVNQATMEALAELRVPSRGRTSIEAARPIASLEELAGLYYIGPRTLERLRDAVAPMAPVEDALCESNDDCAEGTRCQGKPEGFEYGRCRNVQNVEGAGNECLADSECNTGLVCIGVLVYGSGSCNPAWMRDTFSAEAALSIPVDATEILSLPVVVFGLASVPEDITINLDINHSDPSSLWIGLSPPTGQEVVTLWDGETMTGPIPASIIDYSIYRDDAVNGTYELIVENRGGRGEGELRGFGLEISSRWD